MFCLEQRETHTQAYFWRVEHWFLGGAMQALFLWTEEDTVEVACNDTIEGLAAALSAAFQVLMMMMGVW